jgi:hypothetical protein
MAYIWIKSSRKNIGACAAHMFTSIPTVCMFVHNVWLLQILPVFSTAQSMFPNSEIRRLGWFIARELGYRLYKLYMIRQSTKYLHIWRTEQCLAFPELLTPPPPLHPASVSFPLTKGGGVHTRLAVRGWGVNISEDAIHRIGLLQSNLSTVSPIQIVYDTPILLAFKPKGIRASLLCFFDFKRFYYCRPQLGYGVPVHV